MKAWRFVATAALLLSAALPIYAANADYAEGQKLFAAKSYKAAAAKFEAAMRATPRDANTIYYCALANQLSSNRGRARQLYEYINSAWPGTQLAAMASTALNQLGGAPPAAGGSSGSSSSGSNTQTASAAQSRSFFVPFDHSEGPGIYLWGSINGQQVKFHLDTGAGITLIGKNQLEDIGFGRAAAGETFKSQGVGEGGAQKAWQQTVALKIGEAYIPKFPISVQEHLDGAPLLGQDFLRNFQYDVDPTKNIVTFRFKGSSESSTTTTASRPQPRGTIDVPFKDGPGGHILVNVRVNGKPYDFYFDTGADSIAFAMKDLKPLGLEIPSDAREGRSIGVGGETRDWGFKVDSIKLGTIEKRDVDVHVVESSKMDHPLLGQSFFGDYQCKIDAASHTLHFLKGND